MYHFSCQRWYPNGDRSHILAMEECHWKCDCSTEKPLPRIVRIGLVNESYPGTVEIDKLDTPNPGYAVELTKIICESLNFTCLFEVAPTTAYGHVSNGKWVGLLGYVMEGRYDTSIPVFTLTADRVKDFDFTRTGIHEHLSFVTRKPTVQPGGHLSDIFGPFRVQVWLFLVLSILLMTVLITKSQMWSRSKRRSKQTLVYFSNVFIILIVFLSRKAPLIKRSRVPTNVILVFWGLSSIVLIASYTCGLLSAMLRSRPSLPFKDYESLQECIESHKCQFITTQSGAKLFLSDIESSNPASELYRLKKSLKHNPPIEVADIKKVLTQMRQETDRFLVTWPTVLHGLQIVDNMTQCALHSVGYADQLRTFPFRQGDRLQDHFQVRLSDLKQTGIDAKIIAKYRNTPPCPTDTSKSNLKAFVLQITSLSSPFLLLAFGCFCGFTVILCEVGTRLLNQQ